MGFEPTNNGFADRRLGPLGSVFASALLAVGDASGLLRSTNDVIANTGEILDSAASNEDDRVLLEVVALTGDVRRDLDAGGETNAGHLAQRGVRLLGRVRVHTRADAAPLRCALERRSGLLAAL